MSNIDENSVAHYETIVDVYCVSHSTFYSSSSCVCMYACKIVSMHICMYVFMYVSTIMYVSMHVCMYSCMCLTPDNFPS